MKPPRKPYNPPCSTADLLHAARALESLAASCPASGGHGRVAALLRQYMTNREIQAVKRTARAAAWRERSARQQAAKRDVT